MPLHEVVYAAIAVWLFALGASIGSFLNVVVYRVPEGMSLIRPGSHCPACKTPIRWFDNLPILGWIALRGRCRDCGAWISPQYPIVEALTATMFLGLGLVECLAGGSNLPPRAIRLPDAVVFVAAQPAELAAVYVFHLLLLCTLLAAALIGRGGSRPGPRLFLPALAIGVLAPIAFPSLRPVAAVPGLGGWMAGSIDGAAGLATGTVLGLIASRLAPGQQAWGILLGSACVGLFLGWQAAVAVVGLTIGVCLVRLACGRFLPLRLSDLAMAWLTAAALAWILAWSSLVKGLPFPG
ncbi:MAG: prepilin peptidase [Pirellulales bacterium]|nr:prepilin peptidase [Pirellulales bacterium]